MGISQNGGTLSVAGWFISWNIPGSKMDDNWGYPYDETETSIYQWEFQDPKMEVLYHIRP